LIAALSVSGAASDRFGRRPLVLPFAVVAGLISLLFIPAAGSLALLYTGRLLQGVVSGVVFSVANAGCRNWRARTGSARRPPEERCRRPWASPSHRP
jgi:MFS family permease